MSQNSLHTINEHYLKKGFNYVIQFAFGVIVVFIMLSLLMGIFRLFQQLVLLWDQGGITGSYLGIISDVLTLFILIELCRSLVDFFESHRFRIIFLVDATIVFVLREIMIMLFKQKMGVDMIYGLSALLFTLAAFRLGLTYFSRIEKEHQEDRHPADHPPED